MNYINIDQTNIDDEHICCAIGNDKTNQKRADQKKDWMKGRFQEGLVFRRLNDRGKIFIEYMPVENVWKPVIGKNYIMINCLWVSGRFQKHGHAKQLLEDCINDAKSQKKDGVAVVTASKKKGFLTGKKFFKKHGFETVDTAPPYFELMVMPFNEDAEKPHFSENAKKGVCDNKQGFTFMYSNQCPFTEEYVHVMSDVLKDKDIPYKIIKIDNKEDAQRLTSPFGTYSVFYNGEIVNHEIMSSKKFEKFVDDLNIL